MARSRWAIAAPALQLELPAPTLLRAVAAAVVPQPSTWTSEIDAELREGVWPQGNGFIEFYCFGSGFFLKRNA